MLARILAVALFALIGTTAVAMQSQHGLPDLATQYYHRQNCHGAYDLIVEQFKAGSTISQADKDFVGAYEAAGEANKPCPTPSAEQASRAADRLVSTESGLSFLNAYRNNNDSAAMFELGVSVLNGKVAKVQPAAGWPLLTKSGELGYAPAKYLVGSLYASGNATGTKDYAAALPLMEEAAKLGHPDAAFQAANFYASGTGTKKDSKKAFDYYAKAAELGHIYAAYLAAWMVNDGDGVKKDHQLAYRLARNLADQGQPVGAVIAASALLQMKDAKEHENEVLFWMDKAVREGDGEMRKQVEQLRPRVVAAFKRANAPPEYTPRRRKVCPKKTVCLVDRFTGVQQCTTNTDYWNDCDTGLGN
jgi:TPR repeat protein